MNPPNPQPNPTPRQMGADTYSTTEAAMEAINHQLHAAAQQRGPTSDVALDGDTQTFQIKLGNISLADAQFIAGVVALFADPARARDLALLKQGAARLGYGRRGNALVWPQFTRN